MAAPVRWRIPANPPVQPGDVASLPYLAEAGPAGALGRARQAVAGALGRARPAVAGMPRGRLAVLACIAAYLGLGFLANLPVWIDGPSRVVQQAAQGDIGQEVWFLAWIPAALGHGLDPFVTSFINVPWGVNLMDNTAMPLLGLVGAPITLVFGPIAAYNLLFSLAFASSGIAGFLVLRRYVTWTPAAFAGGLAFAVSPYMVGQGRGHLFLVFTALLPVMLWCLDEILVRQERRPVRMGILLGLCAAAQLGISMELLAWSAVMAAIGIVILVVAYRAQVRAHLAHAARALLATVAVFGVVAAFPLYVFVAGPHHAKGPVHPVEVLAGLSADAASFVVPSSNQAIRAGLASTGDSYVTIEEGGGQVPDPAENGSYVGIPLVALLAAGAIRFRRDRRLRFALAMAAAAGVLSLGAHLSVAGHATGIPLPYLVLERLRFFNSGISSRFAVVMWLFLALALALVLDRARWPEPAARRRGAPARGPGRLVRPALVALVGAASLVPLVPAWPYYFGPALEPAWFLSRAETSVPAGSTLLTYPFARNSYNLGMVWQALDGFRYKIPAGEAAVTDQHVSELERIFDACLRSHPTPPVDPALSARLHRDLQVRQVDTVVVPLVVPGSSCAAPYVEAAVGRPGRLEDNALVWRGLARGAAPASAAGPTH